MQVISFTAQFDRWAQDHNIFFGLTLDRTFCKILALNVNNERRNQCQFKSTWEEIYLSVNTLVINFLHSNQKRPLLSFCKSALPVYLPNTKFSIMECMLVFVRKGFQIDHLFPAFTFILLDCLCKWHFDTIFKARKDGCKFDIWGSRLASLSWIWLWPCSSCALWPSFTCHLRLKSRPIASTNSSNPPAAATDRPGMSAILSSLRMRIQGQMLAAARSLMTSRWGCGGWGRRWSSQGLLRKVICVHE